MIFVTSAVDQYMSETFIYKAFLYERLGSKKTRLVTCTTMDGKKSA